MTKKLAIAVVAAGLGIHAIPGWAQAPSGAKSEEKSTTASKSTTYSEPVRKLLDAAQRLRDAAHAMAGAPGGKVQDDAIRQVNRALLETQLAIIEIPPDARTVQEPMVADKKAMDRLRQAAQNLREAAQEMADAKDEDRSAAIGQVNEALFETQEAMMDLYPEEDSEASSTGTK